REHKPKLIICGGSAYQRYIEFEKFKEIAVDVNAFLMSDIAHPSGLVASEVHPSPWPFCDIVTSTTHKTLRGPRGGLILTNSADWAKKINSKIFPGIQGGPLEHVIAAKAVAFEEALSPAFKVYQKQVIENAQALAKSLMDKDVKLVSNGTQNHLVLVKTDSVNLSGKEAEAILESVHITCNKNMIPKDQRSPFVTSGIRLGTPAITTRGFTPEHMQQIGTWIYQALTDKTSHEKIRKEVIELCHKFPVY
ncbi:MAG: serine hydroxymethyltransferase, partial [Bacteriovoracaceae bacterium]|nr:serine hydroxymethyltransferase [Bacteriovoracaceae bacterium]